ncbi:transglycosylase SLT domain protein [Tetragenococcus osmophilus]|uniref:Transglycosylase SLT domain protein n=2 Tax=Tetragenococcus osmophilus TaxID=526944 RepID=A0ABM7AA41_9ENTE|nr:lysozyme family protein [Tetragenococcus osmophilus]AYW48308.1 transglycosylase SLT domain protein [Tetragenococcus osmophilus]
MNKKKKSVLKKVLLLISIMVLTLGGYYFYRNYQILKQVYQYEDQVEQAVEKENIPQYKNLVLSVIFTETKGENDDPMQSSESKSGYPNQIEESQESIEQGVAFLATAIKKAEAEGCDLWTAVQAYNFGLDYIDYVAENGKTNRLELAEQYSKDTLSPELGNSQRTKYRYLSFQSIMHNGGYLYHNGGNFFYADIVKANENKIKQTSFLF